MQTVNILKTFFFLYSSTFICEHIFKSKLFFLVYDLWSQVDTFFNHIFYSARLYPVGLKYFYSSRIKTSKALISDCIEISTRYLYFFKRTMILQWKSALPRSWMSQLLLKNKRSLFVLRIESTTRFLSQKISICTLFQAVFNVYVLFFLFICHEREKEILRHPVLHEKGFSSPQKNTFCCCSPS